LFSLVHPPNNQPIFSETFESIDQRTFTEPTEESSRSQQALLASTRPTSTAIMPFTASDICKMIFAVILPPLGVFLERGCNADFLINILLTILGYLPGIVHALWIICRY